MASRKWIRVAFAALPLLVAQLPSAPAAAFQRPTTLSQSEVAQGREAHPQILQQFGGAYRGRSADYVAQVGRRVAAQSGVSNSESAYTVTLLNSNVLNAFSIPGGYVYVTRQLVAYMNDEAELGFVLGHEEGHVAAHHSRKSQTRSTLGSIGALILGAVTGSSTIANLASQASQFVLLGFSRDQEYEADSLGVRYIVQAGYDPYAASDMLDQLGRATNLETALTGAKKNLPSWASTHPLTSDRIARARALAQQAPAGQRIRNRDGFLDAINGMLVDDDPHQGVVEGNRFRHPDLGIGFDAPAGYQVQNGADSVLIAGNGGQAQFTGGTVGTSLEAYVDQVFRGLTDGQGQVQYSQPRPFTMNGMEGVTSSARANTDEGQVDVTVVAFRTAPNQAYSFTTIAPAGSGIGPFTSLIQSFHRLAPEERAAIRPRYLAVVTVRPGETLQNLAARMAYPDRQLDRFEALNGIASDPAPGSRVKLIVYSMPAAAAVPAGSAATRTATTVSSARVTSTRKVTKRTTTRKRTTRR
jgi:predicted Zn-dependent protease